MREISPICYDNTRYDTNSGYAAMTWCQIQILTWSPLFCGNKWLTSSINYFTVLLLQLHKLPYRRSKDCILVLPDLMFYHFDESKMLLTSLLKVSTFNRTRLTRESQLTLNYYIYTTCEVQLRTIYANMNRMTQLE